MILLVLSLFLFFLCFTIFRIFIIANSSKYLITAAVIQIGFFLRVWEDKINFLSSFALAYNSSFYGNVRSREFACNIGKRCNFHRKRSTFETRLSNVTEIVSYVRKRTSDVYFGGNKNTTAAGWIFLNQEIEKYIANDLIYLISFRSLFVSMG